MSALLSPIVANVGFDLPIMSRLQYCGDEK